MAASSRRSKRQDSASALKAVGAAVCFRAPNIGSIIAWRQANSALSCLPAGTLRIRSFDAAEPAGSRLVRSASGGTGRRSPSLARASMCLR